MWYCDVNQRNNPEEKTIKNQQKMAEKTKYNQAELEEFRGIIEEKLEQTKEDLKLLVEQISGKDGNGTDDTSPTFKLLDEGNATLSKEELMNLAVRQQKFVQSLQYALVRIKNGSYGICRSTGKLIPKERLKLVPHATLSIEAKNNAQETTRGHNVARSFMSVHG